MKKLIITILFLSLSKLYASSWLRGEKITIQSSKVGATLTDFPVMIDSSNVDLEIFTLAKSDGGDIRITTNNSAPDAGGIEVPVDIERFDTVNSVMIIWFKGSSISSTVDTDFWIWYDNSAATLPLATAIYGSQNVWTGYDAVYHMKEQPTSNITDATGGTSLTPGGTMTTTDRVDGKVGFAIDFDGVDDHLSRGSAIIDNASAYTISAWLKTSTTNNSKVVAEGKTSNFRPLTVFSVNEESLNGMSFEQRDDALVSVFADNSTVTMNDNTWHYAVGVQTNKSSREIFVDGASRATDTATIGTLTAMNTFTIAAIERASVSNFFQGLIDEVRIKLGTLSSSWISTEYNNQNSPSTFVVESAPFDVNSPAVTPKKNRRRKVIQ